MGASSDPGRARRARGALTEAERAEWASYARLVRPLPGRLAPEAPAPEAPALEAAAPEPPPRAAAPPPPRAARSRTRPAHLDVGHPPAGLDRATWEKFRTGKLPASRTLDLHGKTAERAFHALTRFLHAAHADRLRCVEVITGRGGAQAGGLGVIRRELPLWLNLDQLRPLVLAAAHPHPANPGSTRLLLRRVR